MTKERSPQGEPGDPLQPALRHSVDESDVAWGSMRLGLESDLNKPGSAARELQAQQVYGQLNPRKIGPAHPNDSEFSPYADSPLPGSVIPTTPRERTLRDDEVSSLEFMRSLSPIEPEHRNTEGIAGKVDLNLESTDPGRYRKQRGRHRAN